MNCPNCENNQWIEEKVIVLAAMPSQDSRLKSLAKSYEYRLRCSQCSYIYGAKTDAPEMEIKENGNEKIRNVGIENIGNTGTKGKGGHRHKGAKR